MLGNMIPQPHQCETCRNYVDPVADDAGVKPDALSLVPACSAGSIWFMDTRPDWSCSGFEREPGDQ